MPEKLPWLQACREWLCQPEIPEMLSYFPAITLEGPERSHLMHISEKYGFHRSNTIEIKIEISGQAKFCRLHSYSDVH